MRWLIRTLEQASYDLTWAVAWEAFDHVLVVPKQGRGLRFQSLSAAKLRPVVDLLKTQDIKIMPATTTVGKAFTLLG